METDPHFKYRVAYLKYAGRLWEAFTGENSRKLLQSLLTLANDSVPNVKLVAIKQMQLAVSNPKLNSMVQYVNIRV